MQGVYNKGTEEWWGGISNCKMGPGHVGWLFNDGSLCEKPLPNNCVLVEKNVEGVDFICVMATRDLVGGEVLYVDYGDTYVEDHE